eukprot:TRINITY_DN13235_c0_g1_i1.p1 TRINITY_DN13235_c0_g1~~TRINITY_DN13235_c0_g1_i1.p1  ORF type:complete len:182 (+),score=21.57 TRINITY_DN13235_c0_g1_i1:306-851(+)
MLSRTTDSTTVFASSTTQRIVRNSCPSPLTGLVVARGFISAILGRLFHFHVNHDRDPSISHTLGDSLAYWAVHAMTAVCNFAWQLHFDAPYNKKTREMLDDSVHRLLPHKQLFLCSRADDIVLKEDVEAFRSLESARGVHSTLVDFEGSGHVQHFRVHPKKYSRAVEAFLGAEHSSTDAEF